MQAGFGRPIGTPTTGPRLGPSFGGRGKQRVLGVMKKGGKIKRTGVYKLHQGEKVMPKKLSLASASRLKARAKAVLSRG